MANMINVKVHKSMLECATFFEPLIGQAFQASTSFSSLYLSSSLSRLDIAPSLSLSLYPDVTMQCKRDHLACPGCRSKSCQYGEAIIKKRASAMEKAIAGWWSPANMLGAMRSCASST